MEAIVRNHSGFCGILRDFAGFFGILRDSSWLFWIVKVPLTLSGDHWNISVILQNILRSFALLQGIIGNFWGFFGIFLDFEGSSVKYFCHFSNFFGIFYPSLGEPSWNQTSFVRCQWIKGQTLLTTLLTIIDVTLYQCLVVDR